MTHDPVYQARILIVDDERSTREFYRVSLNPSKPGKDARELDRLGQELFGEKPENGSSRLSEQHKFHLSICKNSIEAVDAVIASLEEKRPFSVVFLDVRMPPGPDGVWAAEQIRKIDPRVEIVIATAFSDMHPEKISQKVPPVHKLQYLQKPFHPSEINHMASSLASKWLMERELFKIQDQLKNKIDIQKNELSEAYKTLEKMQKLDALGMVAGGISHDFNNLLACIVGHTELALLDASVENGMSKRLTAIHDACMRARKLVQQILTFSRQSEPEYRPMNPEETVLEVLHLIEGSIPANIHLETKIEKISVDIMADATQIHQVVMNLCTNAFHAMKDKGGTLTVCLSETSAGESSGRGPNVMLTVRDSGYGMDENTIEKIFDPYFTTKKKDEGTGLGLSVTHGIVRRQGGQIDVASSPGEGTNFKVIFKGLHL